MISLDSTRKVFNKVFLRILITYVFLFVCVYVFILFSKTEVSPLDGKELVKQVQWDEIFIHNSTSAFTLILLGIISFGVISTVFFIYDFYLIAFAAHGAYTYSGSFIYSLTAVLTHGIFELVAISLNFYISTISFRYLINRLYKKRIFNVEKGNELIQIIFWMLFVFFIASIVEAFVTPNLLHLIVE